MKTTEVPPREWAAFCEKFTQLNQRSLVTVETSDSSGRTTDVARESPLQGMQSKKTDGCCDEVRVLLGEAGSRQIQHLVVEPIRIFLRQNDDGQKILQVDVESGTTLIIFHSGKMDELPGESPSTCRSSS